MKNRQDVTCEACGGLFRPTRPVMAGERVCRCRRSAGLGDIVAAGLDAVGITKERVQAVASAVGVKDCGCAKRQAALNRLGERLGLPPGQTS
jgi:hypothetical protein